MVSGRRDSVSGTRVAIDRTDEVRMRDATRFVPLVARQPQVYGVRGVANSCTGEDSRPATDARHSRIRVQLSVYTREVEKRNRRAVEGARHVGRASGVAEGQSC